jgi:hypothetical protein
VVKELLWIACPAPNLFKWYLIPLYGARKEYLDNPLNQIEFAGRYFKFFTRSIFSTLESVADPSHPLSFAVT